MGVHGSRLRDAGVSACSRALRAPRRTAERRRSTGHECPAGDAGTGARSSPRSLSRRSVGAGTGARRKFGSRPGR